MKKVTFLTCVLALCTSTMFAQTLEVTTADMDPVAAGGLLYLICQRYKFESESQLRFIAIAAKDGCI